MKNRILNIEDAAMTDWTNGDGFEAKIAFVGAALESQKLGFNITVIPPGKRAFPCHAHYANEEMFYILEGEGKLRLGEELHHVRSGDFISIPAGPEHAHQIINDSETELRFLAVSTMIMPEIASYPDSNKYGVFAGSPPGRAPTGDSIRQFIKTDNGVEYWEGEE